MKCKDFEVCGNLSDPAFTMDFTDVEPGAYIYWCRDCGPVWSRVSDILDDKLKADRAGTFADALSTAMDRYNQ